MASLLEAHGIMMKGLVAGPGSLRQGPIGVIREINIFREAPDWKKVKPMTAQFLLPLV